MKAISPYGINFEALFSMNFVFSCSLISSILSLYLFQWHLIEDLQHLIEDLPGVLKTFFLNVIFSDTSLKWFFSVTECKFSP